MTQQILKQQFRNNTGGWTGAVAISAKGDEQGIAVEPNGTVWLSEQEQILTANAPRDPRDNPFIPQTMIVQNPETGAREEQQVTPLVPISENRYVPANERPIGLTQSGAEDQAIAQAAATGSEPSLPVAVAGDALTRHEEVAALGADAKPGEPAPPAAPDSSSPAAPDPAPAEATPSPAAPAAPAESPAPVSAPVSAPTPPSPTAPPAPPTEEPLPVPPTPAAPTPPGADPARAVPADEGRVAPEETAAQSPGPASEETGAAVQPQGEAVAGSFTPGEEVGTPSAPAAPAPWTPGQG